MEKKTYEVKSIEEAYELVKEELGLDKDQVNIEVVEKRVYLKLKWLLKLAKNKTQLKLVKNI